MKFISTKNMKFEDAPKGSVLVKYLEPIFGGWHCQYAVAYFDNPLDYQNQDYAAGWLHENTGNKLNVVAYCELPDIDQKSENPFYDLSQKEVNEKYGDYVPNLGCMV